MAVGFQIVIDCAEPGPLAEFWASALGYVVEPPPSGFDTWDDWYRDIGVPDDEIGGGPDRIVDPAGEGPRIWFQVVPDIKSVKNRLHIDIAAGGGRDQPLDVRRANVDAEVRRLVDLGATIVAVLAQDGLDHYAVAMRDPEGNEFDVN